MSVSDNRFMYGPYVPTPDVERTSRVGDLLQAALLGRVEPDRQVEIACLELGDRLVVQCRLTKMFLIFGAPMK